MNKAILVIDMPKNCQECVLNYQGDCYVSEYEGDDWVQSCPLKEVPNKIPQFFQEKKCFSDKDKARFQGWNDCLDEILGDADETN